jgi:long-chain acyl-CoA synthetase
MGDRAQAHERVDAIATSGAARRADLPAIRDERHALTFADLDRAVSATCDALAALGVGAGQRVLVVGGNCAETVVLFFAISRLGAWSVMASDRLAAAEIEAIVAHCSPRLIAYATPDVAAALSLRCATSRLSVGALSDVAIEHRTHDADPERDADHVAALLYTSGTTGAPKAVMLSHANLLHIARTQAKVRRYAPGDRVYCALPIAHAGGLASISLGTLAGGGCLQLVRRFVPAALDEALRNDGVTVLPGVPALHVKFGEWLQASQRALQAPKLRMVTTASSPLQATVKATAEALYGLPLQNGYGLTETSALVCQTRLGMPLPDVSVGAPFPGVRMRIATADGAAARNGDVGEVLVQGPNLFLGYYRNEAATRAAFTADGWFATCDLARETAGGDVFIVGRS